MDHIDLKYAMMLSNQFDMWKVRGTSPYRINMRCKFCGDSQKSKYKARGWLLERDNSFHYYCHNCGASQPFGKFLKTVSNVIYNDYVAEKFVKKTSKPATLENKVIHKKPVFVSDPIKKIRKLTDLKKDHPARQYIDQRQLPEDKLGRIYYAPKFKAWVNSLIPNKLPTKQGDEPRLVFPFLDKDGVLFGFTGRGFDPKGLRYITIMLDETMPKLFGLDKVDFGKPYCVVEGAIDSLFLSNAVAMAGADGNSTGLENIENAIYVFDAEPRNKELHRQMEKVIKSGVNICIWPSDVKGKDLNEMHLNGEEGIEDIIIKNTFKGLEATLKFMEWKKR